MITNNYENVVATVITFCTMYKKEWNKTEFLNYYWTTNPEVREARDVHAEDGENSFKIFIGFNFKQLL
jgi:hypothetical protein